MNQVDTSLGVYSDSASSTYWSKCFEHLHRPRGERKDVRVDHVCAESKHSGVPWP